MKQLTKTENIVFLIGAVLMVAGSGAAVLMQKWGAWLYTLGAIMFVLMQLKQTYGGTSITIQRLRGMVIISDLLLLATAFLMFADQTNFLRLSHISYVQYIHGNWVITLLVAAVLQLYSSHRLDRELKKEQEAKKS